MPYLAINIACAVEVEISNSQNVASRCGYQRVANSALILAAL